MSTPTTLLKAIGEIMRPALLRHGPIQLEETAAKSTCAPITLNKKGPAVVVKPDAESPTSCPTCRAPLPSTVNDRIFGMYNHRESELTSVCDYIIFYREREDDEASPLFVFLCELKSKHTGGVANQTENGRMLADHVLAMARHHRPVRLPDRIVYRALISSTKYKALPKGRLETTKWAYEYNSERMDDLGFAFLPCGASYPLSHFCA